MAHSEANGNPCPDTGSTCTCCGSDIPPGREGNHDIGPGAYCLVCERTHLSADMESATAALEVVSAAIRAALHGYVSPQDIVTTVAEAIEEMTTVPADPVAMLSRQLRENTERIGPDRGHVGREVAA